MGELVLGIFLALLFVNASSGLRLVTYSSILATVALCRHTEHKQSFAGSGLNIAGY